MSTDRAHRNEAGRRFVPEHETKSLLARHGVTVPRGTTDPAATSELREPFAVKAFGPSLVHKSDVGAVRLGVSHAELDKVVADLLAIDGATGVLVEEQAEPGVELLVGIVDRGLGPMLAVGMGGTLTEVIDDVTLRLLPVTADDVRAMLRELRGHVLLRGYRGKEPVDDGALVDLVLRMCALADELGSSLVELECNPVIVTPRGAIAVDARLILDDTAAADEPAPATDFTALFAPRGVAVAGASATKQTFGNRFLAAYRAMGWTDRLAAIHPSASEIDGVPAYPSVRDVPFELDYVVAAVPAAACADLVRSAAGVVPFVHVISGGFSEASGEGHDLELELRNAARTSGVRVLGPNCMGTYSPRGRQTFQLDVPQDAGHVSIISQSGGLAGDIVKAGAGRGLRFSKLVTIGNAIDVTPGELCEWLVDDDDTHLLGLYLEDPRDGARLAKAFRKANEAGKPVVVLVGGLSDQGGRAVASHTGSLAGDRRMWQAVSKATGCSVVDTLEDLLGSLAYLQRHADATAVETTDGLDTLIIGVGGGASVLTTDACDRAGLRLRPVDAAIQQTLREMGYGAGTSVANPIEIPYGPAAPLDAFSRVLTPILERQSYRDVLVHVNVQSFFSFTADGGEKLLPVVDAIASLRYPGTRVAFVARNLDVAPGSLADELLDRANDAGVVVFRTADEAAVAIAAAQRADLSRGARRASPTPTSG
ncbi:MAG TPA: acetate--CoA ligase family protein [Acidimicrobiales bacterium]